MSSQITNDIRPGLHVVRLPRGSFEQAFITVLPLPGDTPVSMFARLAQYLGEHPELTVIRQDVFGLHGPPQAGAEPNIRSRSGVELTNTWLEEDGEQDLATTGIYVCATSGIKATPIMVDGHMVGDVFEDEYARYCVVGNLHSDDASASREDQAQVTFEKMERSLRCANMDFSNVIRTWFFIEDILDWYGPFNKVRTAFYTNRKVFQAVLPASTGIGAYNATHSALIAALFAVDFKDGRSTACELDSPLQGPAPAYGSSFSRAVELATPDHRWVSVSGTASIAPSGETAHVDDVDAQIDLTMRVVHAILDARKMGWEDVVRGIIYFRHHEDVPKFADYCQAHNLPPMPTVVTDGVVCRDDLLFEVEVDAVAV